MNCKKLQIYLQISVNLLSYYVFYRNSSLKNLVVNIHILVLNVHTLVLNIILVLNVHTLVLNVHILVLNIHILVLNVHLSILKPSQQTAHVFSSVLHQLKLVENWWKTDAVLIPS